MAGVALLVTAVAWAQGGASHTPSSVKEVMLTMTIPSSDVIFDAASEPPKNDQQWVAVRKSAAMLAESGKLLTTGELAKDNAVWMDMARALVTQAEMALKAAGAKNGDALSTASDDVYVTCETCHMRYMPQ